MQNRHFFEKKSNVHKSAINAQDFTIDEISIIGAQEANHFRILFPCHAKNQLLKQPRFDCAKMIWTALSKAQKKKKSSAFICPNREEEMEDVS